MGKAMTQTPYADAAIRSFWRHAIENDLMSTHLADSDEPILRAGDRVMSAGSCFAAATIPFIESGGFTYIRTETLPAPFKDLSEERFGYSLYSAAYGHIYTSRQILQLLQRATNLFKPKEDRWLSRNGIVDPFRPGMRYLAQCDAEFRLLQRQHLERTGEAFRSCDAFIFTLGQTEAWLAAEDGAVFPACPGTVAGAFDSRRHHFKNFTYHEVVADLSSFVRLLAQVNKRARIILSVSPVPMAATASGRHVAVANSLSKSTLRLAADVVVQEFKQVRYLPVYEMFIGPNTRTDFFAEDRRHVSASGLSAVFDMMSNACGPRKSGSTFEVCGSVPPPAMRMSQEVVQTECEDDLLDERRSMSSASETFKQSAGHVQMQDVMCCTIVAKNYLPFAKVCATSYVRQHPGHQFVIAVIDADRDDPALSNVDSQIKIADKFIFGLNENTYLRMATVYNVTEFATSLKPSLLRALRLQAHVVIYLDPDIVVYSPMRDLSQLALRFGIVLTPHFLQPLPRDGLRPDEQTIMSAGIFNLGFIAVGPGSEAFVDFWAERLRQDAIIAFDQQLFTDQRWIDQVPALFQHHVLRDPGFNVAYWNAHERKPTKSADGRILIVGEQPLRFFHFSGYRPESYPILTYHCPVSPRVTLSQYPALALLCRQYNKQLRAFGYGKAADDCPYGYARWGDGACISEAERRIFREDWIAAERMGMEPPPHAFGPDGGAGLRALLRGPKTPREAQAGLNRLAVMAWSSRPDVQAAYPDLYGTDAAGFRQWCRNSGVSEGMLPAWAVPEEPYPNAAEAQQPSFGVNLLGYLTSELGHGEMGRLVHEAITQAGIPVASTVEEASVSNRKALPPPTSVGPSRYSVSIFVVNADQVAHMLATHSQAFHYRYRIGVWAWELEEFPAWLHSAFDLVDEIWTVSEFVRTAVACYTRKPVRTFPVPVKDPGRLQPSVSKKGAQFFFAFDFNSVAKRKNATSVVEAFQTAFTGRTDVRLVIKAINGAYHLYEAEQLRLRVAGDERIQLLEQYLTTAELDALYAASDAYVSLHRSEGFGLTVAEAMARGLPVIATDYSSTREFFGEFAGWPVPYKMVQVGSGCDPYQSDALWAEPDVSAAARAMWQVVDDPIEARRRGEAGRAHILQTRTMKQAAAWVLSNIQAAHDSWQASPRSAGHDTLRSAGNIMDEGRSTIDSGLDAVRKPRHPLQKPIHKIYTLALSRYDRHIRNLISRTYDTTTAAIRHLQTLHDQTEVLTAARDKRVDNIEELLKDLRYFMTERDKRFDSVEGVLSDLRREAIARRGADGLRHSPAIEGTSVVHCDAGILVLPTDNVILPWITYNRCWEPDEAKLLARLASERNGAFLDVGAHVGYHTLRVLASAPNDRTVIAVEADELAARCLRRNLQVNLSADAASRVSVHVLAAWNESAEMWLAQYEEGNSGDKRISFSRGGTSVDAKRLDELADVSEAPVTLVKTDLQGRDHRAIAGLEAVIATHKPDVVCEYFPHGIEELGDEPIAVLQGYQRLGFEILPFVDGQWRLMTDLVDLVKRAKTTDRSFLTLWLRPCSSR